MFKNSPMKNSIKSILKKEKYVPWSIYEKEISGKEFQVGEKWLIPLNKDEIPSHYDIESLKWMRNPKRGESMTTINYSWVHNFGTNGVIMAQYACLGISKGNETVIVASHVGSLSVIDRVIDFRGKGENDITSLFSMATLKQAYIHNLLFPEYQGQSIILEVIG